MRTGGDSARPSGQQRTTRTLGIIAVLGLVFGLVGMGEVVEDMLRIARNDLNPINASGDIVLVEIDDYSQREGGAWPWKRSVQAAMIDKIEQAGAKRVVADLSYDFATDPAEDKRFAETLERWHNIVLPVQVRLGDWNGDRVFKQPLAAFRSHVTLGTITVYYNYAGAVWKMPYALEAGGRSYRSLASLLSGVEGPSGKMFPVDYRFRMNSIPRLSAVDILSGRADLSRLKGKTVVIGPTAMTLGDLYAVPGRSRYGGVVTHIYAAETLKLGRPIDLGWLPALLAGMLFAVAALRLDRTRIQLATLVIGAVLLAALPLASERHQLLIDIVPGIFVLIAAGAVVGWRRYRASGFINAGSGLPNLNALKARRHSGDRALIVARVLNYAQLAATLTAADEKALIGQVVARLGVGTSTTAIYQGDDGLFAWLAEPGIAVGHHVEALHSLFRSPARIGKTSYDIAVSFGVEIGSGRTVANRLGSALVAADEAAAEGLKWKYHDPERFKDENWRLSLLAQLDQAIDRGEVWVAYQPQLDLASGLLRGAEALARWTHPEKGPISPHEFITAAEQFGRIDRLTLFMLDRAIAAAAAINRDGIPFQISVNLSARTLARRSLPGDVRRLLEEHGLAPALLTLELTETAALATDGSDLDPLIRLRDLGVMISIDDYGTGMSTLDYLKKVPAGEIKIDQSFIKAMNDTRSDLLMVKSTIALAHSLGRTVVAEGVENRETLDALTALKCDVVQGYLIARPMSYEGLQRRLNLAAKGRAA